MTSVLILLSGFDPGTYFIEDDGIPNNGIAQLRGPDGSVIYFNIPTEFLTVTASAGRSLVFNLTESFGAADINVGSLTDPLDNPDSITVRSIAGAGDVMLAASGAITEGGTDASADIVATTLIMSAGTGVGTSGNALETKVATLEAETGTGGIAISNQGFLTIGGLSTEVEGLAVATSGNLTLINAGGIDLNDETGFESVRGGNSSGDVSLIANGFDSDIRSLVDLDSIAAPGGNILLQAGRDVSLGTQGLNFDNDVRARGTLTINTGRDLNIDGFADFASDGFGAATGGNVIVNAGRDINILNATGTDGSIGAEGSGGGDVVLNAGPGGFVRLLATSTSTLFSSTGDVTINADRLLVSATAGITASGGVVSIQPRTSGWNVNLGSVTDGAFALEISDAELDRIFTPTLNVGSFTSGQLAVTSALSPAALNILNLRAGTDIRLDASLTLTGSLALLAGDNIYQTGASTVVSGATVNASVDQTGDDGGLGGIASLSGVITATGVIVNGNNAKDTLRGSDAGETINGNGDNDILRGMGGNDTLNGGLGSDSMAGGLGDDFIFVDSLSDVVIEAVGEGNDRVFVGFNYALDGAAEIETLSTTNNAGTTAIVLTGNGFNNTILGNAGNNSLNGGGGADTMYGYDGDDFFFVNTAADVVVEGAGMGTDRVFASATYTLGAGVHVETLTTTDAAATTAIGLTGNELVNSIVGNAGNNTLNGGVGADTLNGQGGDDFFFVDHGGDVVIELAGWGTDRVFASVNYTLGAGVQVETLSTTDNAGVGAINLTGNELVNALIGNAGNNTLNGGAGADTLSGLAGDDFYFVDNALDAINETVGNGADRVFASVSYTLAAGRHVEILSTTSNAGTAAIDLTGNELVDSIVGNAGTNVLDGKGGADTLNGFGGADIFQFSSTLGGGNIDAVLGFNPVDDTVQLENAIFTGLAAGALAAGAFNTGAAASQADDRIIYNSATGALLFDVDGVGGVAGLQFATLSTGLAMTAADFFVI